MYSPVGLKTVAASGTPIRLSATSIICNSVLLLPMKAFNSSAAITQNVGNIYIGRASMNIATGANVLFVLTPAQSLTFLGNTAAVASEDVSYYYVDADNAGDGVLVSYSQ